ncbi:LLM class flavin-dependent oxidoreductase [Rhabdobacter roseus]|uniref:Luciferase family oxidoreductase group 1 n=1 Tax=Rhabdobacter roseus TaxID=1655419 RepID=A0A840TN89_9BACT|nr:MsnO8 family LLM class oxidoreductase [Rhabdobacter roseus]MBB5283227.1 luciferase family oxidoreductase group 1 [Rhabdobacter roseus]
MKLSIVDLSTVLPGETRHDAFLHSIEVAQLAEQLGFERVWVAEHHGSASIAGRAPEVLIATLAAHTSTIRLGSGSVLLNHYSPFKVAEVFCTLNELYPGRIDLGAGRATTGPVLDFALQQDREKQFRSDSNQQLAELVAWLENSFPEDHPFARSPLHTMRPLPQLHLLGSSTWSASAAAQLGLRYVFAGFINQQATPEIIQQYRDHFRPADGEAGIQQPEVRLAVHVVCADSEAEARRQIAPVHVMYRNLSRGNINAPILDPDSAVDALGGLPPLERYLPGSGIPPKFLAGTPEQVHDQLEALTRDVDARELIIQDLMTEHPARLHSYQLLAQML